MGNTAGACLSKVH